MFGSKPTLCGASPCKQDFDESISNQIDDYASKCMLDSFISICKTDYVGVDSKDSTGKMTHEICKQITSIAMEVRSGGCLTMITPDELYGKYISTAAVLPVDATTWSIKLCSSYFNCLVTSIQDKMEDDDFCMPPLSCQLTKTL